MAAATIAEHHDVPAFDRIFLDELAQMGFTDWQLNLSLLKQHAYVIPRVVDVLLQLDAQPPAPSAGSAPPGPSLSPSISPPSISPPSISALSLSTPSRPAPSPAGAARAQQDDLSRGLFFVKLAVEYDEKGMLEQAFPLYVSAIEHLTSSLKDFHSAETLAVIQQNISIYLARAQLLKSRQPPAPTTSSGAWPAVPSSGPTVRPAEPALSSNTSASYPYAYIATPAQPSRAPGGGGASFSSQRWGAPPLLQRTDSCPAGGVVLSGSLAAPSYPCIVDAEREHYHSYDGLYPMRDLLSSSLGSSGTTVPPPQPTATVAPPSSSTGRPNTISRTWVSTSALPTPTSTTTTSSSPVAVVSAPRMTGLSVVDVQTPEGLAYTLIQGVHESIKRLQRDQLALSSLSRIDADTVFEYSHSGYSIFDNAPYIFNSIRRAAGYTAERYLASFKGRFSGLKSPGKSGSQLFFTDDLLFILKSVNQEEFETFRGMLFSYFEFLQRRPDTLLIKLYGLITVRVHGAAPLHFVVMENIAPPGAPVKVRYDLKGSTFGRTASAAEKQKPVPLLKDMDFQRRLYLGPRRRAAFLEQISADAEWLASHNIMDYSLLLCIADANEARERCGGAAPAGQHVSAFRRDFGGFQSSDENERLFSELYYVGVIDIFQTYNLRKKLENSLKSLIAKNTGELSCVDSEFYCRRFVAYMRFVTGADGVRGGC